VAGASSVIARVRNNTLTGPLDLFDFGDSLVIR